MPAGLLNRATLPDPSTNVAEEFNPASVETLPDGSILRIA